MISFWKCSGWIFPPFAYCRYTKCSTLSMQCYCYKKNKVFYFKSKIFPLWIHRGKPHCPRQHHLVVCTECGWKRPFLSPTHLLWTLPQSRYFTWRPTGAIAMCSDSHSALHKVWPMTGMLNLCPYWSLELTIFSWWDDFISYGTLILILFLTEIQLRNPVRPLTHRYMHTK